MNQPEGQQETELRYFDDLVEIVRQVLQLPESRPMTVETELLGAIPEFDSMSVVTVLTALEERYEFVVDDDDVSAETFETLGTLLAFVQEQLDA